MSPVVLEKKAAATTVWIPGLSVGTYYWSVRAIDAAGKESDESSRNKFSIVPTVQEANLPLF